MVGWGVREEEERGGRGGKKKYQERPQARRDICQRMSPERQNTQHPKISIIACRKRENMFVIFVRPRRNSQDKKRKKKRIKICRRKCQWKMYSPSGSKRFSIKKKLGVWRCWTGAVQAGKYRGSASPPRSVSLPVLESCDSGFGQSF